MIFANPFSLLPPAIQICYDKLALGYNRFRLNLDLETMQLQSGKNYAKYKFCADNCLSEECNGIYADALGML